MKLKTHWHIFIKVSMKELRETERERERERERRILKKINEKA
jgi:hypothetical protein